jgi:hypothetical protein
MFAFLIDLTTSQHTMTGLAQIRLVLSHLPAENIALLRFLWYASKALLD